MRILIRGVAVIPKAGSGIIPRADVVIEGRRFSAVVVGEEVQGPFDKIVEGEGKILIPGLVNTHTHLAMTLFRSLAQDLPLMDWLEKEVWPREKNLSGEIVYWFSLLGLVEMIRSGTTAFADMYFFMEEVAEAVEKAGLRALLSYGIIAPTPERIEPELKKAEAFAREWDGKAEGRIRAALSPHAPYTCGPEVWRRCTSLAKELRIPIHTHLAETKEEVERFRSQTGRSPVEWLEELGVLGVPTIAAHCVHVSEKDIEILAAHGTSVAHCPTSNLKLACGIAPVVDMLKGGVNVSLGTDGPGSAGNLNMLEEMRLAALLAKVKTGDPQALPAREALGMATWRGAAALGWGKDLGTIEPGRRADGVMIRIDRVHWVPNYDPLANLVYAAEASDVDSVFVDGRFLLLAGELQTLDEEDIVGRCRELAEKFR
ncbi:MAG: amidohydrolase [Candidatus Bipolaricaulota bacterium]|nr:amidohydrolase [Candidatus Bipolaricaulota bacterium]MDW8126666.1 amidohydrolase [Candidatus Bipolaricaulota bacterium]